MPVVTEPVLREVVPVPGVVVSSEVDPVLVDLLLGAEVVDDAPVVDEPRPEIVSAIPGLALLVAVATDALPVVTEKGPVGLIPAVLVPREQVTQCAAFVAETIKGQGGVLRTEGLNLAHLGRRWLEETLWWEEQW